MKKLLILSSIFIFAQAFAKAPEAMFSPYEGVAAFERMYKNIESAKKTAHISIYSWSDAGVTKAMEKLLEDNPNVDLRVILHRPLARKAQIKAKVAELEKMGAMFKMAKQNMHEKFILIDSEKLVNSSANMSGGAKTRYAEDFVFIDSDGEADNEKLIESFEREFAILWNTADDMVSEGELRAADVLNYDLDRPNIAANSDTMTLHSSSMNFMILPNKKSSADYKKGRSLKMVERKTDDGQKIYAVSSAMIRAIDNAKKSVKLSLNHFNLYSVSEALIRAVKRGVEVKLAVDNQEFKTNIRDSGRTSIEMTPRFVRDFKKIEGFENKEAPVRIKFYSQAPHHSRWFLNHHKYMIIDDAEKSPVLFAGSFNISNNAEFKQFDNLVEFKGSAYKSLINSYVKNHSQIWNMNRDEKDQPMASSLNKYKLDSKTGLIRIHASEADDSISLTWKEAIALKDEIGKSAPKFFSQVYRNKACAYYNVKTDKFLSSSMKACKAQ